MLLRPVILLTMYRYFFPPPPLYDDFWL